MTERILDDCAAALAAGLANPFDGLVEAVRNAHSYLRRRLSHVVASWESWYARSITAVIPTIQVVRFYALWMREVGMIKSGPQKIIGQGTDWRFLNELKKKLKG